MRKFRAFNPSIVLTENILRDQREPWPDAFGYVG